MTTNNKTSNGELLRVPVAGTGLGVDREAENKCGGKGIIRGVVMAQLGPFKSEGRGEFDLAALQIIQKLTAAAPNGNKSRLAHPDESHDGVDKTLGRFYDQRLDTVGMRDSEGTLKTDTVPCVRGDLHINPAADKGPFRMGDYVMTLAETDPDVFSTSLVLQTEKEYRRNPDGTLMKDAAGEDLPPLWRPTAIMACDVVSTGDACDGLLSKMGGTIEALSTLPNGVVFAAAAALDKQFSGKERAYVEGHCRAFLTRYLDRRYGPAEANSGVSSVPLNSPDRANALAFLRDVIALAGSTAADNEPGSPDAPQQPGDENPNGPDGSNVVALHDGCRSTLAYHHLTACRQCGATIQACGCDNVGKESRVITMAKEPCPACKALEAPGASADAPPAADANERPDLDLAKAKLFMLDLD